MKITQEYLDALIEEYDLIGQKKSKLSAKQRLEVKLKTEYFIREGIINFKS